MAKRTLTPDQLAIVAATRAALATLSPTRVVKVIVACSGGADSMALAAGAAWLQSHEPDPLRIVGARVVDHGLQPGSDQLAMAVANRLAGIGLDADVMRVDVASQSPDGLEAAARQARYDALVAGDVDAVFVGHTMDDQAETVLLGLARGSGTRSLAGMAQWWWLPRPGGLSTDDQSADLVTLIRPLLGLRRAATRQACLDWGLTVWDDPMNDDPRFTRVRARQALALLDEALGPGFTEALSRTASLARQDADYLDDIAGQVLPKPVEAGLPVLILDGLPPALRGRALRQWLAGLGVDEFSYERTLAVLSLVDNWHGQAGVDLPGGRRVVREQGMLKLKTAVQPKP